MLSLNALAVVVGLLLPLSASAANANCAATDKARFPYAPSVQCTYTTGSAAFVVPAGVTSVSVFLRGGSGGNSNLENYPVGTGGQLGITKAVTPGQSLRYIVATSGSGTTAGAPGGAAGTSANLAAGGYTGGAGGGKTLVTFVSGQVATAGGGGGAAAYGGGGAGGLGRTSGRAGSCFDRLGNAINGGGGGGQISGSGGTAGPSTTNPQENSPITPARAGGSMQQGGSGGKGSTSANSNTDATPFDGAGSGGAGYSGGGGGGTTQADDGETPPGTFFDLTCGGGGGSSGWVGTGFTDVTSRLRDLSGSAPEVVFFYNTPTAAPPKGSAKPKGRRDHRTWQ